MYLESEDVLDRPADQVYKLVRDELPKLVPYLPNINKVEVVSRKDLGKGRVEIVNRWYAKAEVPSALKKVINPELFSWKDTAVWIEEKNAVEYKIESLWGNDLYEAKGINTFSEVGDGKTKLKVTCEINIHADRIPGVPSFLAKKMLPTVEALIKKILEPNLTSLAKGLDSYFAKNK